MNEKLYKWDEEEKRQELLKKIEKQEKIVNETDYVYFNEELRHIKTNMFAYNYATKVSKIDGNSEQGKIYRGKRHYGKSHELCRRFLISDILCDVNK